MQADITLSAAHPVCGEDAADAMQNAAANSFNPAPPILSLHSQALAPGGGMGT
jgi:hypothetical protein